MIPVRRDEITTRPARTDFNLRLHGDTKFHPVTGGQYSTLTCLDFHTFSLNFSL